VSIKPVRCAIYTRVSTDHGLEQDFNSLDAQHDAAQAYIRSQAHAGPVTSVTILLLGRALLGGAESFIVLGRSIGGWRLQGRRTRAPHDRTRDGTFRSVPGQAPGLACVGARLKLDRLRLRGPSGARDEFLLAATAQNLRKLAKLIPIPSPKPA
jgi:hypothetical protein